MSAGTDEVRNGIREGGIDSDAVGFLAIYGTKLPETRDSQQRVP